jgi:hypothetical protein
MTLLTSQSQRDQLESFIQTELLKRGFQAPIEELREKHNRSQIGIEFHTPDFQTTPVLFRKLHITSGNSSIRATERTTSDGTVIYNLWVSVNVRYMVFDGGSNGTKLFDVNGEFAIGHDGIHNLIAQ